MWDIGGQPRFRSMWARYCRGVDVIVFMVDSADELAIQVSDDKHQIYCTSLLWS